MINLIKWLIIILLVVPRVIYSEIKLAIMCRNKTKYSLQQRYDVVRNTVLWLNRFTRRRFNIESLEVFTKEHSQGRVYVSNHHSIFEVLTFIELSKKPLIFISKKENKRVPFLRTHLKAIDTLCIDRKDIRQSLKICRQAGLLANQGNDIVIFAEGTRSKDGNVAPFKAALPTIIHYSQTETVLVCMYDTKNPLKWRWFKYPKENVYLHFFEPLSYNYYLENRKQFNVVTRDLIQNQLEKYKREVVEEE